MCLGEVGHTGRNDNMEDAGAYWGHWEAHQRDPGSVGSWKKQGLELGGTGATLTWSSFPGGGSHSSPGGRSRPR